MKRTLMITAALVALLARPAAADGFLDNYWREREAQNERWQDYMDEEIRQQEQQSRDTLLEQERRDQQERELELEQRIENLERQLELERDGSPSRVPAFLR